LIGGNGTVAPASVMEWVTVRSARPMDEDWSLL